MKAYLDDDCFRGQDAAVLTTEGVEAISRLESLTLTGSEREDVEEALSGGACDPERLRIIWQNHLSELLAV